MAIFFLALPDSITPTPVEIIRGTNGTSNAVPYHRSGGEFGAHHPAHGFSCYALLVTVKECVLRIVHGRPAIAVLLFMFFLKALQVCVGATMAVSACAR